MICPVERRRVGTAARNALPENERVRRIRQALEREDIDAVLCTLPAYVLLASGYWPVIGTSFSITTRDGRCAILAPEDEEELAKSGWADQVRTYSPASLDRLQSVAEAAREPLRELIQDLGVNCSRIGYERGAASEPASYAAMHVFGEQIVDLLRFAAPSAPLFPADRLLAELAAVKTPGEVEKIRGACGIVARAFEVGREEIAAGRSEAAIAAAFRAPLSILGIDGNRRADGFVWCMSGTNSAQAGGAYARSRARNLERGDLVLVHCNSYADGYWTDVTRTYVAGEPDSRQRRMYDAVLAAREAALRAIRPGECASAVDRAAREVIHRHGFSDQEFKHSTGHGVGFAAISANARPRLHPKSEEILEPGMVFNVEPALYIHGYGGIRHCEMVAVTEAGAELLTGFHSSLADLVIHA